MSATLLKLIPADPEFVPSSAHQQEAINLLGKFFRGSEITVHVTDETEFVDQGSNFDDVRCNYCNSIINTEDWQEAMDKAYETRFTDLYFITPCCDKRTSLNDLVYNMPAGFSRFFIVLPSPDEALSEDQLNQLSEILKAPLKVIYAHY